MLLSAGIVISFLGGFASWIITIISNRYLHCHMYRIALYLLSESLLSWIFTGLIIASALSGFLYATLLLSKNAKTQRFTKQIKLISVSFLCITAAAYGIWYIHSFWWLIAPTRYHWKLFLGDGAVITVCIFFAVLFNRINWEVLNSRLPIKGVYRLTVCFITLLIVISTAAVIDKRYFVPERTDIVLISIDTLRADHLGCYGYRRKTSPHIDAFAEKNIVFTSCYAQEPWTLPSHMSMLTSLYPFAHGIGNEVTKSLPRRVITLAELLKNKGFGTYGFASGGLWMHPGYGFKQGFDYYHYTESYCEGDPSRNAEFENRFLKKYLKKHKQKNNFIFIHYFDVHSDFDRLPYDAPPPYNNYFSKGYEGDFQGGFDDIVASKYLGYITKNQIELPQEDLEYIKALYDNGIAYMDHCIGQLFTILKELNLYQNSLIIITSDHGEAFYEHQFMGHGQPLYYEEQVHVPLIIKLPENIQQFTRTVISPVELIDIMPFILDIIDINAPEILQGSSFYKLIEMKEDVKFNQRAVYGLGSQGAVFVRQGWWKLINDSGPAGKNLKLFNLQTDPLEKNNIANANDTVKKRLMELAAEQFEQSKNLSATYGTPSAVIGQERMHLDTGDKDKLKALGYLND